jgi:hypothetical protein
MRIDKTNEFYHQGGIYVHEIYHMDENYSIGESYHMNNFHCWKWQSYVIYLHK